ncbi:preprotein translocase subunit SecA [Pseudolysinimonas yzui]|uniref:Preprotein translocase subunit SecA n=1 Tax=Pseudolysinimonas yzui TaxID=2708254 RepID=A0A8J3GSM7_9MICO|nr:preprotein translocase subunit SecA [Pseudolysinimonas yzui]GHF22647.1 hypothetical protein GCM10011600_24730 [Pseudolysinimonas yzui]
MSGSRRKKGRSRGPRAASKRTPDIHAEAVADSVARLAAVMHELLSADAPLDEADRQIELELDGLKIKLQQHRPERVVELARLACLPWAIAGLIKPDTEGGIVKAELLSLIALTSSGAATDGSAADEVPNALYQEAHEWAEAVGRIIQLLEARLLLTLKGAPEQDLERVSMHARAREVWIRNTSYPDMIQTTHDRLFGHGSTPSALTAALGFDARDAHSVMTKLHELQTEGMNQRLEASFGFLDKASATPPSDPDPAHVAKMREMWNTAWQPTANLVAISSTDVASATGLDIQVVEAVLDRFAVDLHTQTTREIVDGFMVGDNPLRTNPVIRTDRGQFMLVHDALVQPAIRENLEQALKGLPAWDEYAKWRGDLLEDIGKVALEKVLPGATAYLGFDYFVPANDQEGLADPASYTKKVEGDMLFVLDDVAIIVEAKAVAITPAARAGDTRKLRRNLTDLISKASEQAARLQRRIEEDGGARLHAGGWLDLSHVREIHTVALSLEDLSGVATATSDLIDAGLLDQSHIPWVVSIHDLQIIVDVVDRPAEFLLYLRRRRDPEVSLAYTAPDELDLFLYFYERGLYVAPDPVKMVAALPHLSAPSTGDLRRRAKQGRALISTRTDPLDAWHYSRVNSALPPAPKPTLSGSPMIGLADELQSRGFYAWLSLGATLLSGSTKVQAGWSRAPKQLLARSSRDGRERTLTVPIGNTLGDSWLLVWMSRPTQRDIGEITQLAHDYLKAKKYQLKFPRGAVLIYDEGTKELLDVAYDGTLPHPDPQMDRVIAKLLPVGAMASPPPPSAKPGSTSARKGLKRKRR